MLERESLGTGWCRLRNQQGEMLYRSTGPGTALLICAQKVGDEFTPELLAQLDQEFGWAPRLRLFIDLTEVTAYGAELRQGITDWLVKNRHRVDALVLVKKGALVEMAARVASHLTGGRVQVTRDRSEFEGRLQGTSKAA